MSAFNYTELKRHLGHKIVCIGYRQNKTDEYQNVAVECEDCSEVLLDYDIDDEKWENEGDQE